MRIFISVILLMIALDSEAQSLSNASLWSSYGFRFKEETTQDIACGRMVRKDEISKLVHKLCVFERKGVSLWKLKHHGRFGISAGLSMLYFQWLNLPQEIERNVLANTKVTEVLGEIEVRLTEKLRRDRHPSLVDVSKYPSLLCKTRYVLYEYGRATKIACKDDSVNEGEKIKSTFLFIEVRENSFMLHTEGGDDAALLQLLSTIEVRLTGD